MKDRNALRLACVQKTNPFEIDECYFLQVQSYWRFTLLNFGSDFIQARNSKFAAESNPPFEPLNPQRHLVGSGRRNRPSKQSTICDRLYPLNLDRQTILIFQEFLFDEENTAAL